VSLHVLITHTHHPLQLILDITLCGDWAGVPSVYNATCSGGTTGLCVSPFIHCVGNERLTRVQYTDNVVGPGSPRYDNAYFTINYVRVYTVDGLPASISASLQHTSTGTGSTSSPTISGGSSSGSNPSAVLDVSSSLHLFLLLCVGVLAVFI
jgi:hypothetical protein